MKKLKSIGIIGAGKVATQLAKSFITEGIDIAWIWSRSADSASKLSTLTSAPAISDLSNFLPPSDLILISITDDAVVETVKKLSASNTPVVHTSGSLGIDVLQPLEHAVGVFYPLQTFSLQRNINMKEVPICIEASNKEFRNQLFELASLISDKAVITDFDQRICLHIAAIFACNFTNYMYSLAEDIMKKTSLSFSLLHPLIKETASKAVENSPEKVQTGPAARGDISTITNHIIWLENQPELKEVYELLSSQMLKKPK